MNDQFVTVFAVAPEVAEAIGGRYVCLNGSNNEERWFTDHSLVSLSRETSEYELDWPFIERALAEKGVYRS